ncbi:Cro/Cl family transcriptional regulator [Halobacteriovorax sp. BALOs_7]|uniref:ASCH domain-containing protein n=1 Tax=Halobacteriovorax sp. BALOs_7 TaxID=2109558 RepID=UPI000EA23764|nr:ASCH domain-containing protein [Halobacteriovorax sp. BALOs_7]AYF45728.1 Cro/Cl family transcriptional regulator [Halobacteriovorax sp. BALOs_7]
MENSKKEILLSVKPQYANLLVDGIKTIELRKKFPMDLENGTKVYVYSSFPQKMVIGEVLVEKVEKLSIEDLWRESATKAMISWTDFKKYYSSHEEGYAIHVSSAKRYEKPIMLAEVHSNVTQAPQSYRYLPVSA